MSDDRNDDEAALTERREFPAPSLRGAALAGAGVLAACGGSGPTDATPSSSSASSTTPSSSTSSSSSSSETSSSSTSSSSSSSSEGGGGRRRRFVELVEVPPARHRGSGGGQVEDVAPDPMGEMEPALGLEPRTC